MPIRVPFPADVNPEPNAKYRHTLAEAFPCDASQAKATQSFPAKKRLGRWLAVVLLALIAIALAGCGSAEAQQSSASPSEIRRAAAELWSCPGMEALWLDETTVQCLNYLP